MVDYNVFDKEFLKWHMGSLNNMQRAEAFLKNVYNEINGNKENTYESLEVQKEKLDTEPQEGYVLRDKKNNEPLVYSNGREIVAFKDNSLILGACKDIINYVSAGKSFMDFNLRIKISGKDLENRIRE